MTFNAEWTPRRGHASVALPDGSIVLMGGTDASGSKNDVWRSTDNGETWTRLIGNASWSGRNGHASVALPDGSIVLVGGQAAPGSKIDTWHSTDGGTTWTQLTPDTDLPARYGHTCVALPDGGIVLMGGQSDGTRNDVWIYTGFQEHSLSVKSLGAVGVIITADPTAYGGTTNYTRTGIASGTQIILTAPMTSGSATFSSWVGCDETNEAERTCTVTMNTIKTVTVNYITPSYALNVKSSGAFNVLITGTPGIYGGTTNYTKSGISPNTEITLTAPESSGNLDFTVWTGCDETNETERTCTVTMNSNKTVTVQYGDGRSIVLPGVLMLLLDEEE